MPLTPPATGYMTETIKIVNVGKPFSANGLGTIKSVALPGIRAYCEPIGGSFDGDHNQKSRVYQQEYRIWVRYSDRINPFQQVMWGTRQLWFTAPPEEIVPRRWILIHAAENIDQGI